eukprot:GHVR01059104.1.p1 GENE.GHVR01059104.1~~GHVR01059104.1.p1  ORF type:complete len:396 (+),score=50.25 GHVR01059104.1:57-1244(+)
MNRFLGISLLAVTVAGGRFPNSDFKTHFENVLNLVDGEKSSFDLIRVEDTYTFQLNVLKGKPGDPNENTHTCVFDHQSKTLTFEDTFGLQEEMLDMCGKKTRGLKNMQHECDGQSVHLTTKKKDSSKIQSTKEHFEDDKKYPPGVNCSIGIMGVKTFSNFFCHIVIQFSNMDGKLKLDFTLLGNYEALFHSEAFFKKNVVDNSIVTDEFWVYDNNKASFNFTNRHTIVSTKEAQNASINELVHNNSECGDFKEMIIEAVTHRKLINLDATANGKKFWEKCGRQLIRNVNRTTGENSDSYKSSFTTYDSQLQRRNISVLFINDNFKEPEEVLTEDQLSCDPWNVRFDVINKRNVTFGISMLEDKTVNSLVFYQRPTFKNRWYVWYLHSEKYSVQKY